MAKALYYWLVGQTRSQASAAAVAFTLALLLTGLLALSPDLAFAGTGGSEVSYGIRIFLML